MRNCCLIGEVCPDLGLMRGGGKSRSLADDKGIRMAIGKGMARTRRSRAVRKKKEGRYEKR
jgi:hypothetical protein